MFNLEGAIRIWRRQMAGSIRSSEVLDELESHLREEITRQIQSGATEQQAYEAAVARLGEPAALRYEFAKIGNSQRSSRKFLRGLYVGAIAFVLFVNTWNLLESELSPLERLGGFFALSLVVLYLSCLPQWLKTAPPNRYLQVEIAIKLGSNFVVVWSLWSLLDALHLVNFTLGFLPTIIGWCLCAAAGLSAVAFALNASRRPPGEIEGGASLQPRPIPPNCPAPPEFLKSAGLSKRIDPSVERSLEIAHAEALRLGHDFIGTEHVLLALLKLNDSALMCVLGGLNLSSEGVQAEVEKLAVPTVPRHAGGTIPFTPRSQKAMRLAQREAKALNHCCVSPEHIFVGLLCEGGGLAGQVLRKLGVNLDRVRQEIARAGC